MADGPRLPVAGGRLDRQLPGGLARVERWVPGLQHLLGHGVVRSAVAAGAGAPAAL